ncbi:hypothetical protein [Actinoplanes sp. URMC 104]|uniref:hypothetical protein n=1 Tax=Actinoplanes sp. URMC 104 TaxID=3423409 RepID=UPI003F1C81BA
MAETVTVIRPAGKDAFGDPLPGSDQQYPIPGCEFAPGASKEAGGDSNQVNTEGTVYATKGVRGVPGGVQPTDLIEVRGKTYAVHGEPQDWGRAGYVIELRRYTG